MPKVYYNGLSYDSELEVDYAKYLEQNGYEYIYHPKKPIKLNLKNTYTPDFIVFYVDRIEIIETKGYNQFSFMKDNMTHNLMLEKTADNLIDYLLDNGISNKELIGKDIQYKKIKYLKAFGFVDWDFKNPNTIANKRKEKINVLTDELKELKNYKKNCERYFEYIKKIRNNVKLTKSQNEWLYNFECEKGIN